NAPQAAGNPQAAVKPQRVVATDAHGDPLPEGALARLGTIRLRHDHRTTDLAMAFSPDTKTVVTAGNGILKRWDVATGKLLGRFADRHWFTVMYAPNGKWLASGGDLIDASTGQLVRRLDGGALAFSPDGKLLAAHASDGAVTLWNTTTGEAMQKLRGHDKHIF